MRRGTRIAPRILQRGAAVHAAFVPTQAGPLAGDRDAARITVGPGAALVVEPVAATLALPGPARTVLELDIEVQADGRLVLDEAPLVVAAGADVHRRTTVELQAGAVAALREIVVLGRVGEGSGGVDSSLHATLGPSALLRDALRLCPGSPRDNQHVALPPGDRIVSTACLLGVRPREACVEPAVMNLHGPGAVMRGTGVSLAGVEVATAGAWRAWSQQVMSPSPASPQLVRTSRSPRQQAGAPEEE